MNKPNCYDCKWRGNLVGDTHSCCKHPKNGVITDNPIGQLLAILSSAHRIDPFQIEGGLNVVGNLHGIKNGWFNHPFNFDPTWLESCDGFEVKE